MNRLTKRGRFGTALVDKKMPRIALVMEEYQDYYIVNKTDYGVVIDRLAEYEDLGYEPDELKIIIHKMEEKQK